jgi:hypothetical protein
VELALVLFRRLNGHQNVTIFPHKKGNSHIWAHKKVLGGFAPKPSGFIAFVLQGFLGA